MWGKNQNCNRLERLKIVLTDHIRQPIGRVHLIRAFIQDAVNVPSPVLHLQESYERARTLLKSHSAELHALSQALMKHETLDSNEIKVIMEGKQLDKS